MNLEIIGKLDTESEVSRARIQFSNFYCTWNVVDVDVMITVYEFNKNKVRVQIQQVQKPQVPYFTYEPPRRFISKINNLRLPVAGL